MPTFYLDYELGSDAGTGADWANAWKTFTLGATLARIAPGDIIRVAKSPAPTSIGNGTWTNLSKTVTLATAQNLTIDLCETAYTAVTGLVTVVVSAPTNGGTGYTVDDILTITTGGTGATVKVTTVSAGVVTAVIIQKSGNGGYTTGAGKATTGGTGNADCTVEITTVASAVVTRTAVATDAKEGSYSMKIATPTACSFGAKLAYFAIAPGSLAAYQKMSFWVKNSAAITAGQWRIVLCSDTIGETVVDEFKISAIPSAGRWLPLTLARTEGGNLNAGVASIAIYTDTVAPPSATSNIIVDDFIACTTAGLNLQSLISKNSLEQGGTEGWYGIQSINGVTVLLDNTVNTLANAGRGYSTSGTTPETVETFKRETIKTVLAAAVGTLVQEVMDSGTLGNNIEFQGGYDITSGNQTGETLFDGLNGWGQGIYLTAKSYITLNYLNTIRYDNGIIFYNSSNNNTITTLTNTSNNSTYGVYFYNSNNNTITVLSNCNNNGAYGIYHYGSSNNVITTLSNANNNVGSSGIGWDGSSNNNTITTLSNANNNNQYGFNNIISYNNTIITLSNVNNNGSHGIRISGDNNLIILVSKANSNTGYGVYYAGGVNNVIRSLSTTGNTTGGVFYVATAAPNYLNNALIAEATEIVFAPTAYLNYRVYSNNHQRDITQNWIMTDGGLINSVATDRVGGTGIMWKLAITSANRSIYYPLKLSVAKIAVVADKLVTVKIYMKKDHATNVGGKLVCPGGQLIGMTAADYVATKADDLNTWEELTITFTPSQQGVVEIEAWAYYVAANANVYVEDITITQAE